MSRAQKIAKQKTRFVALIVGLCSVFAALSISFVIDYTNSPTNTAISLEQNLGRLENRLQSELDGFKSLPWDSLSSTELDAYWKTNKHSGELIWERNDSVIWYSNNQVVFPPAYTDQEANIEIPNGLYYQLTDSIGENKISYLYLLNEQYLIENSHLRKQANKALKIPLGYEISPEKTASATPIHYANGELAFYLTESTQHHISLFGLCLITLLYLTAFIALYVFLITSLDRSKLSRASRVGIASLILAACYLLFALAKIPSVVHSLYISSPLAYGYSTLIPSLSSLSLLCIIVICLSFYSCRLYSSIKINSAFAIVFCNILVLVAYACTDMLVANIAANSSFTLHLNRVAEISFASVLAYLDIGLVLYSILAFQLLLINSARDKMHIQKVFWIATELILIAESIFNPHSSIPLFLHLAAICALLVIYLAEWKKARTLPLHIIVLTAVYAFFCLATVLGHVNGQEEKTRELFALLKEEEHDAELEVNILSLKDSLLANDIVADNLSAGNLSFVEAYVHREYFSEMNSKYDVWVSVCTPDEELRIEPEGTLAKCYAFFDQLIESSGVPIDESGFYYITNNNGLLSYFGKITFHDYFQNEQTLFIQLDQRMSDSGLGFPKLLVDKNMQVSSQYADFSYAIYNNNQLSAISGNYPYPFSLDDDAYPEIGSIVHSQENYYNHTKYYMGNGHYIIVSSPTNSFDNYVFSYPYIFLLFLLIGLFSQLIKNRKTNLSKIQLDLGSRIQLMMISTVLIALILISTSTILYNSAQYKEIYRDDINEKMLAISSGINARLSDIEDIERSNYRELEETLANWSNIFRSDINIYDTRGLLIASSRPVIFHLGLNSRWMNHEAFRKLSQEKEMKIVQTEHIGNMDFLSAYEPIINTKGNVIAYVNLPYFTRNESIKQDTLDFIVTFINLSALLLFISIIAAIILSNQITKPLSNIRKSLSNMSISKQNKPILYSGNDEIGALVDEYNNKLMELEESAQLLARSQREMAWKEMAKQIAHEIKNPLTPMKLQIQHLQMAKRSGDNERYDAVFSSVTDTLIEQIDRLTGIANSFSRFAKMPEAKPDYIEMNALLQSASSLFDNSEMLTINLELPKEDILVYADKEQASRAVINLIKNAKQAVKLGEVAIIDIKLEEKQGFAFISVSDNGSGVPAHIKDRLFEPNFTTKSSGMGLGLAIVKQYIESAKGSIWFENKKSGGSIFWIKLPLQSA